MGSKHHPLPSNSFIYIFYEVSFGLDGSKMLLNPCRYYFFLSPNILETGLLLAINHALI